MGVEKSSPTRSISRSPTRSSPERRTSPEKSFSRSPKRVPSSSMKYKDCAEQVEEKREMDDENIEDVKVDKQVEEEKKEMDNENIEDVKVDKGSTKEENEEDK